MEIAALSIIAVLLVLVLLELDQIRTLKQKVLFVNPNKAASGRTPAVSTAISFPGPQPQTVEYKRPTADQLREKYERSARELMEKELKSAGS